MSLAQRIGVLESWARTVDRTARTQNARDAQMRAYAEQIDPDHLMDPETLAKAVKAAHRAHCLKMAEKSARVRKARKALREADDQPSIEERQAAVAAAIEKLDGGPSDA